MISFEIVNKLFQKFEKTYGDHYYEKYALKKLKKLKMGIKFLNTLYSKFINLIAKLEFIKEILLQEFIHKLFFYMQNSINSRLKYLDNIKDLIIYYQKSYDYIIIID